MQNFTPLAFSTAEKSVTIQNDKQTNKITHSKLSTLHTTVWWGNKKKKKKEEKRKKKETTGQKYNG